MCARFTLMHPWADVVRLLRGDIRAAVQGKASWNIAPTHQVAIVEDSGTGRHLTAARWGLAMPWSTQSLINARAETVATKPAFRKAIAERRCLIPTTGFYEWRLEGERTRPYLFRREDGALFVFAGIVDFYKTDGGVAPACAILTTSASKFMEPFHTRMPVILPPEAWDLWLDRSVTDTARIAEWLGPPPENELVAVPVSPRVHNPRNNGPECIETTGEIIR